MKFNKILSIIIIIVLSTILGLAYTASDNLELRLLEADDDVRPLREDLNYNFELVDDIFDDVTLTEFSYLDGVTSSIQDQIDGIEAGEGTVDTSGTPVANDIARFTDLNTIEGRSYSEFKADLDLEIGTDILAQQSIGITDNYLLEVDGSPNSAEYARFTANGLEGRTEAEFKGDFNLEIGTDVQAYDAALASISGLTYVSPSFIKLTANDTYAVRTLAEVKTDLSINNVENTALSTWVGTENITTLGTISTGVWSGTALLIAKLPISTVTDADVTNIPNCNNVFDFCETTKNYALNSELHTAVTIGTANGLSLSTQALSLALASTNTTGALSDTNWNTFNNKEPALTDEASLYSTLSDVTGFIEEGDVIDEIISFDHALGSDEDYSGITDTAPVGETVAIGDLLYYDWTDVEWKKADADSATTMPAMRIALEAKDNGQQCLMLIQGYIRNDNAFEFTAAMVYASDGTAGITQSAAPADSGDQVQRVGIGITANVMYFCPSIDVGEI